MAGYRELMERVERAAPTLSVRARTAIAASCADAAFPLLAMKGSEFEGDDACALAVELPWLFTLGVPISSDELRWALLGVRDRLSDWYHHLHRHERGALRALIGALEAALEAERDGVRDAFAGMFEIVDAFEDKAESAANYRWLVSLLERAEHEREVLAPRWLVHLLAGLMPSDAFDDGVDEQRPEWLERLARDRADRIARVATLRANRAVPPWREPDGIPRGRYSVREAGRAPSARAGKIVTPGHQHYAVFDARSGALVFAPRNAVALGMSPDLATLIAWRVEKRGGVSGIGRADYDWILERYRWPECGLVGSQTIGSREVIDWHWPVDLRVPLEGEGRWCILRVGNEDESLRLHVVTMSDGSVRETLSDEEAATWAGGA